MAVLRHNDLLAIRKRYPESVPDTSTPTRANLTLEGGFLEAWAQGYSVGSLIILILIVFCNYRSGTWLHKLILLEVGPVAPGCHEYILMARSSFSSFGTAHSSSSMTRGMDGTSQPPQP